MTYVGGVSIGCGYILESIGREGSRGGRSRATTGPACFDPRFFPRDNRTEIINQVLCSAGGRLGQGTWKWRNGGSGMRPSVELETRNPRRGAAHQGRNGARGFTGKGKGVQVLQRGRTWAEGAGRSCLEGPYSVYSIFPSLHQKEETAIPAG